MRRVAVYARVSTEHEAQLSALENQIQYYDNELDKHPDWVLYDRYIDEGITGTSTKKRPNFMRMMKDAENGCFDLIITREVSRFARNTVDTLQETRKLRRMGIEVYFTEDHIWTMDDNDGELKLTLMATLAQNESRKTSQRVKAGQKISFENGVIYGTGNILGYDKVGKDFIVNEEQARTVRKIYDLYLKGNGMKTIKYELESQGYKTSTGKSIWDAATISRVLQNSFYCGIIEYRKFYVPDYLEQKKVKNNGEVEKVFTEGKHTPLISREDFNKVQEMIKGKKLTIEEKSKENKFGGKNPAKSIWSKKLVCKCGSRYNKRRYHKHADGTISHCYQCYDQKNNGSIKTRLKKGLDITNTCDSQIIPEWKLELVSNVLFKKIWKDREQIKLLVNTLLDKSIIEDEKEDIKDELQIINRSLETLQKKNSNLFDAFISEIVSKEMYVKKKLEIEEEEKSLKNKISELNKQLEVNNEKQLIEKLKKLKSTISKTLDFDENYISSDLIDSLIDKITVYNNRFTFKLKGDDENKQSVLLLSICITEDNFKKLIREMNIKAQFCGNLYIDLYY